MLPCLAIVMKSGILQGKSPDTTITNLQFTAIVAVKNSTRGEGNTKSEDRYYLFDNALITKDIINLLYWKKYFLLTDF